MNKSEVRPLYAGSWEIWKRKFHSEHASKVYRPHYAGGIWKRKFHSENLHTTPGEFEDATITCDIIVLEKTRFQNVFRLH